MNIGNNMINNNNTNFSYGGGLQMNGMNNKGFGQCAGSGGTGFKSTDTIFFMSNQNMNNPKSSIFGHKSISQSFGPTSATQSRANLNMNGNSSTGNNMITNSLFGTSGGTTAVANNSIFSNNSQNVTQTKSGVNSNIFGVAASEGNVWNSPLVLKSNNNKQDSVFNQTVDRKGNKVESNDCENEVDYWLKTCPILLNACISCAYMLSSPSLTYRGQSAFDFQDICTEELRLLILQNNSVDSMGNMNNEFYEKKRNEFFRAVNQFIKHAYCNLRNDVNAITTLDAKLRQKKFFVLKEQGIIPDKNDCNMPYKWLTVTKERESGSDSFFSSKDLSFQREMNDIFSLPDAVQEMVEPIAEYEPGRVPIIPS